MEKKNAGLVFRLIEQMKEEVNIFKIKYNLLAKQTNKQTKTCKTLNYIEP